MDGRAVSRTVSAGAEMLGLLAEECQATAADGLMSCGAGTGLSPISRLIRGRVMYRWSPAWHTLRHPSCLGGTWTGFGRSSAAYAKVLEKLSERTRGASPAAAGEPSGLAANGPAYAPVAEPWPAVSICETVMFDLSQAATKGMDDCALSASISTASLAVFSVAMASIIPRRGGAGLPPLLSFVADHATMASASISISTRGSTSRVTS